MNSENNVNNVNSINSIKSVNSVYVARCCLHLLWYFSTAPPPLISTSINAAVQEILHLKELLVDSLAFFRFGTEQGGGR